jgi:hypothetical protein
MKRKIYVETSVISYLTARPSKTIIGAAHQLLLLLGGKPATSTNYWCLSRYFVSVAPVTQMQP